LARSAIAALSAAELNAVERGYRLALWNPDAVYGLGYLYHCLTRFKERASLYQGAAQRETDPDTRLDYLLKAGSAYFAAADPSAALAALHQAMLLQPNDQRSYRALAMYYGSHGDLPRALASVRDGIAAGADSVGLNIALAEAGWKAGDRRLAVKALDRAVAARPTGFADNLEIGVMYLDCENPARAIPPLKNAVATNPRDADGYYYLASAEQNSYDFAAAAIAFKTALSIAPQRTDIRQAYAMFERMLNKSRTVDSDAALDPGRGRAGTTVPLEQ
jgi:Tfp pilus assembly protein PilF